MSSTNIGNVITMMYERDMVEISIDFLYILFDELNTLKLFDIQPLEGGSRHKIHSGTEIVGELIFDTKLDKIFIKPLDEDFEQNFENILYLYQNRTI